MAKTPAYRRQKSSNGQDRAFVELDGKRHYLGAFDDPTSKQAYHRLVSEWMANGQRLKANPSTITITEVCSRYYQFVEATYQEPANYTAALRPLRKLYGPTPAVEFGPLAMKTVRETMVKLKWSRKYVNKNIYRLKRMFKWAKNEQLIPSEVFEGVRDFEGLKRGQTTAPETKKVKPVSQAYVDAIEEHASRQVWAMVQLQLLTAARPGEIVIMRPCDIDRSGEIWVYRPDDHKTAYLDYEREIYIGKRGQAVLKPFLETRLPQTYLFSPAEADEERKAAMREARKTSVQPSQLDRRKEDPQRKPQARYTTSTYARAISYAVKAAFRPADMDNDAYRVWKAPQHWHPNQLRHNAATFLRKEFGLEVASIILGHKKVDVTQVYAERDIEKAVSVIGKVG